MSWTAGLWLLLAPPSWQPRPPEPPTVWAEAGSRPWGQCRELERLALVMVTKQSVGSEKPEVWADRTRLCPGAPAVLVAAAMIELTEVPRLPPLGELPAEVEALAAAQRSSRRKALLWLEEARQEASRREQPPPPLTWTLTAIAAIGMGEPGPARLALREAVARGEVEEFRLDRLAAVVALMAGDLSAALDFAHRAQERSGSRKDGRTALILALIYDRSGAADVAQRELTLLRPLTSSGERLAIEALLPVHERLYLQAIEQLAGSNRANAALLFKAYLASAGPEAAERRLVERRIAELRPR